MLSSEVRVVFIAVMALTMLFGIVRIGVLLLPFGALIAELDRLVIFARVVIARR